VSRGRINPDRLTILGMGTILPAELQAARGVASEVLDWDGIGGWLDTPRMCSNTCLHTVRWNQST
jgi:hypothetical protein